METLVTLANGDAFVIQKDIDEVAMNVNGTNVGKTVMFKAYPDETYSTGSPGMHVYISLYHVVKLESRP